MNTWLIEQINNLASGCVAIIIGGSVKDYGKIKNDKILVLFIDKDLKKGQSILVQGEDIDNDGQNISIAILDWIVKKIVDWDIRKRRAFHNEKFREYHFELKFMYQIDLLYINDKISHDVVSYLKRHMPANGLICSKYKEILSETAQKNEEIWSENFVPDPPYNIKYAQLIEQEKKWIYDQAKALAPGSVYVEIGSHKGGSAAVVASANPNIHIVCVDIWLDDKDKMVQAKEHFNRNLQFYKNIIPIHLDVNNISAGPDLISKSLGFDLKEKGIDLLFIDGSHRFKNCLDDINIYVKYIRKGICFLHDAYRGDIKRAINAYFGYPHEKLIAQTTAGAWFITKKGYYVYGGPKESTIWAIKR